MKLTALGRMIVRGGPELSAVHNVELLDLAPRLVPGVVLEQLRMTECDVSQRWRCLPCPRSRLGAGFSRVDLGIMFKDVQGVSEQFDLPNT